MSDSHDKDSSFLKRVAKFVSSPVTEWGDASSLSPGGTAGGAAAADRSELQVMIERKRRNDFVRRQELDLLRQVRRQGLTGEQVRALQREASAEASGYEPTQEGVLPASELRRRIDGIERDMAYEDTVAQTRTMPLRLPDADADHPVTPVNRKTTSPIELGSTGTTPFQTPSQQSQEYFPKIDLHFEPAPPPEATLRQEGLKSATASTTPGQSSTHGTLGAGALQTPASSRRRHNKAAAIEHDPVLDEAAIAFANADFAASEKALRSLLSRGGAREGHLPTWQALLDLYRAMGQQQRFDATAAAYVKAFGEAAPTWVSIPRLAMKMHAGPGTTGPLQEGSVTTQGGDVVQGPAQPIADPASPWRCPAQLDSPSVQALRAHVLQSAAEPVIDWTGLKALDRPGADALRLLLREWSTRPVKMGWDGVSALFTTLDHAAPPGDHLADPAFWLVRLETLRLLGASGPYQLASEDYAATYGAAAAEWSRAAATIVTTGETPLELKSTPPVFGVSTLAGDLSQEATATVELVGQLTGDISATMARALSDIQEATTVLVSCSRLIHLDLMAAGELLNWVSSRCSEGRSVQFTEVHRMVALFLCAMGLDDLAHIELRPL